MINNTRSEIINASHLFLLVFYSVGIVREYIGQTRHFSTSLLKALNAVFQAYTHVRHMKILQFLLTQNSMKNIKICEKCYRNEVIRN